MSIISSTSGYRTPSEPAPGLSGCAKGRRLQILTEETRQVGFSITMNDKRGQERKGDV